MSQYQFRVLRWIDFLTFGLPVILAAALTVGVAVTPGNPLVGKLVTGAMALGFAFVYAALVGRRLAFARAIAYVTSHGLVVMQSEWTPIRVFVEKETERVVQLWEKAVELEREAAFKQLKTAVQRAIHTGRELPVVRPAVRGVVVRWATAPFSMHVRPGFKWMGLTSGSGESMMVARVDPLDRSALGHEIGHVIMMKWRDDGSEETLKRFHDKYGTPY